MMFKEILDTALSTAILVFEVFCYFALADTFLHRRFKGVFVLPIAAAAFISVYGILLTLLPTVPTVVFAVLDLFALICVVYKGHWAVKAVLAFFYWVLLSSLDYGIIMGLLLLLGYEPSLLGQNIQLNAVVSIFAKLLIFMAVFCIRRIWRKKKDLTDISKEDFTYLMLVPSISVVSMLVIANAYQSQQTLGLEVTIYGILLFAINAYTVKMLDTAAARRATADDNRVLQQQVDMGKSELRTITETQERLIGQAHDMNNHLNNILSLVENAGKHEVTAYIKSVHEAVESSMKTVNSHNVYVDAILNHKIAEMKKHDISVSINLSSFEDFDTIEPFDLTTILANTMDNAIEATLKNRNHKSIHISLRNTSYGFKYVITNTVDQDVPEAAFFETTKEESLYHGKGLSNVKRAVAKYEGECHIFSQNNEVTFICTI